MSMTGVCQVCETAEAEHTCQSCGSLVCDQHFVETQGHCTMCAGPAGGKQL